MAKFEEQMSKIQEEITKLREQISKLKEQIPKSLEEGKVNAGIEKELEMELQNKEQKLRIEEPRA